MNIQVAVLCDAATDDNGKLNLLGSFDTIYAPQMPAVHPQCAVALRVTFHARRRGRTQTELNFINADGRPIMQAIELPVPVALPDDAPFPHAQFHRQHPAVEIRRAGPVFRGCPARRRIAGHIPLLIKLVKHRRREFLTELQTRLVGRASSRAGFGKFSNHSSPGVSPRLFFILKNSAILSKIFILAP